MDYCGIASAVVFSNLTHASAADANASVRRHCAGNPRFQPSFLLAPAKYDSDPPPADLVAEMRAAGATVAWLRPAWQGHGVWPWLIGDLLKLCSAHRLPVFLPVEGVSPNDIHEICRAFPDLRLVLANLGYRADGWLYPLLRQHRELRICLGQTYCPALAPDRFVQHFGPARMIFGSGLPACAPGGLLAMVMYSQVGNAAQQQILAGNIEQLMHEVRW